MGGRVLSQSIAAPSASRTFRRIQDKTLSGAAPSRQSRRLTPRARNTSLRSKTLTSPGVGGSPKRSAYRRGPPPRAVETAHVFVLRRAHRRRQRAGATADEPMEVRGHQAERVDFDPARAYGPRKLREEGAHVRPALEHSAPRDTAIHHVMPSIFRVPAVQSSYLPPQPPREQRRTALGRLQRKRIRRRCPGLRRARSGCQSSPPGTRIDSRSGEPDSVLSVGAEVRRCSALDGRTP